MKTVFVLLIKYAGSIDEVRVFDNMTYLTEYLDSGCNLCADNLLREENKDFDTGHIIYTTEINNMGSTETSLDGYVPIIVQRYV